MSTSPIYLDHSATTPARPEVVEAMLPYLTQTYGNAGSIHRFGREARKAVDDARERVAALIHADPRDIVFTGSGTEADNMAVLGVVESMPVERHKVIVTAIEHHAVLHAADHAQSHYGAEVVVAPVTPDGIVDVDAIAAALDDRTCLVSVMHANNEIGTIQPIETIARMCAERGIAFHTDAVQSAGKLSLDIREIPVSFVAMSAHKLYAPKGVGAAYLRKNSDLVPRVIGGEQERERRAGTENVAGIVGFGVACELAARERDSECTRLAALRDQLEEGILSRIANVRVNGDRAHRLPHISNMSFVGLEGESIILGLDMEGIAVSSGSACTSGSLEPSHVILALGHAYAEAQSAVRFSLGRSTTPEQIAQTIAAVERVIARLRA